MSFVASYHIGFVVQFINSVCMSIYHYMEFCFFICRRFNLHSVTFFSFPENNSTASPADNKGQWYVVHEINNCVYPLSRIS